MQDAESRTAQAFEALVAKPGFGAVLARSAENVAALTRIGADIADLAVRNLRLAGRSDITRLARQLHRTEDKLERILQEVEELRDEVARQANGARANGGDPARGTGNARSPRGTRQSQRSAMSALDRVIAAPANALEFTNILLTTEDAVVGASPRDVVWTHRETTLYRYRSSQRQYGVPLLLVFALINRPQIFDLRPGSSLIEYLLEEGFDVFLVDWGSPGRGGRRDGPGRVRL